MRKKDSVILFLLLTAFFVQAKGQEPTNFKDAAAPQKTSQVGNDWKAEANVRIEKYRKEDVNIRVTQNGKPVKGATVKMDMTDNEFRFGSNIFAWSDVDTPEAVAYRNQFADLLNFATFGFYWAGYESEQGKPQYAATQKVADWCKANGIHGKGHPLIWNTGEPRWVKDMSDEELYKRQLERAQNCVEYFKESIDTWDVINEVVGWDREQCWTTAPRLTSLVINKKGKTPFTKAGFEAARKGNPNAILLINDWMVDDRYEDLLDNLTDENGQPVFDAVGIQSHMHYTGAWSNDSILYLCDKFAKYGKPIHFTEVTILSTLEKRSWGLLKAGEDVPTDPEGEEFQREGVERFYTMVFSHPATAAITWWDFSDKNAWRFAPAGLIRSDMTPKPAYTTLKKLIKEDWATHTTIKTDKSGVAKVRAFRGTYSFTISLPNGKKVVKTFSDTITKDKTTVEINIKNETFAKRTADDTAVPQTVMQTVYEEIKTPYKYGMVVVPEGDKKVDSPSVFRYKNQWYMTYIVFDGQGYETWLAKSDNLLQWQTLGKIMSFTDNTWDANQKAGYIALQDFNWGGSYEIEKYKGSYWMSYLGGATVGYEAGVLGIGMAHTDKLTEVKEWKRLQNPVLMPGDADARSYDNDVIYKSTVIHDKEKSLGHPFVMYYNAKGSEHIERIAMAVSDDMTHWKRYGEAPVIDHHAGISGDAQIVKINDLWVMFYFGAFWKPGAFERFACSYDLVHWTDWEGVDLVAPSEPYDDLFAHKPYVIKYNGVVYHFYNAVNKADRRGIAVATSKDLGKSNIN